MTDNTSWYGDSGQPEQPAQPEQPGTPPPYDPYGGQVLETPPPKKRRGVLIGAVSAFVVLAGAGAVVVATQLAGGGTQPEALAPSTTFAFAKVDLDPAASQKLAVKQFADHFPSAPKAASEDIFDAFVAEALQSSEDKVDFKTDVEPWLGKRVGIAGFTDAANKPQVIGILQSKDDGKARDVLGQMAQKARGTDDEFAFGLNRGYAVIGDTQPIVDQAIAAAEKSSLNETEQYGEDVDRLTGDQVVVGWTDLSAVLRVAQREIPDFGAVPNALTAQLTGRVVVGGHAASDYVELEGLGIGIPSTADLVNARPELLTGLPASTVAALSVNNLGPTIEKSLAQFGALGIDEMLGELEAQIGLTLKGDILPLLSKQTVLALGSNPMDFAAAKFGLLSKVLDAAKARSVGARLEQLAAQTGAPLQSEVKGDTFYLALGEGYLGQLTSGKGLGSKAAFTKAMGELGDEVAAAVYVDIAAIVDSLPAEFLGEEKDLKALSAFGLSAGRKGDMQYFRVRLTVR